MRVCWCKQRAPAASGSCSASRRLAWSGSRLIAEGTILAARLRERLPGAPALFTCASLWYMAAEAVEPHHAGVAPAVVIITLAVAAWLALRLARAVVGAFARAAIAIQEITFHSAGAVLEAASAFAAAPSSFALGTPPLRPSSSDRDRSLARKRDDHHSHT